MKRETLIWTLLFVVGGLFLSYRALLSEEGMAKVYVKLDEEAPGDQARYIGVPRSDAGEEGVQLSLPRTFGIWLAAFFTLAIYSFLYRDNPFYKIAESVLVGVSAAYWMVVGFWTNLVPNLMGNLAPETIKGWALPGLTDSEQNLWYLIPLFLGILLLWRLSPVGGWIARWPIAFVMVELRPACEWSVISRPISWSQIRNAIVPFIVYTDNSFDLSQSLRNITMTIGVLSCLAYFFFSVEHKGAFGRSSRSRRFVLDDYFRRWFRLYGHGTGLRCLPFGSSFFSTIGWELGPFESV